MPKGEDDAEFAKLCEWLAKRKLTLVTVGTADKDDRDPLFLFKRKGKVVDVK